MDVRISDHKPSSLHPLRWCLVEVKVKIHEFLPILVWSTPGINDSLINSKKFNSVQFSSHLLTCWLNITSVNYSAQIQHKYKKTKHETKQQHINQQLKWQPTTWIDHITLRYITLPMPTQQPQTVHMTNTNCTLTHTHTHTTHTHTPYYIQWKIPLSGKKIRHYSNNVITPTNAHASNMFYRTLLISNMFR